MSVSEHSHGTATEMHLSLQSRVAKVLCRQAAFDWTTGRKRSHSNSNQITDRWGAGGDNTVQHCSYCVMRSSCIGMMYT